MKVLITGSNGLLGLKLVALLSKNQISYTAASLGENRNPECPEEHYVSLDITNSRAVDETLTRHEFTHILHTAAMTHVDACEMNPEECYAINHWATKNLFDRAVKNNLHFTFLSTDFVFDGEQGNYSEGDAPNPLSVYGKSKWLAEQDLLNASYTNWAIARTIIVYGEGYKINKSNIISWLMEELPKGHPVSLLTDHYRAPTWAEDLAEGCFQIINRNKTGIFHLSGPETLSIYEIGLRVANFLNVDKGLVHPILSTTLNQKAPRPSKTGFNLSKAKSTLGYIPHSIEATLNSLNRG